VAEAAVLAEEKAIGHIFLPVLRTDTGNFNRFLTSLGLLMLLGALVIPYFYFGDTSTLRVPKRELKQLTPVAREALETRQHRNRDLEPWVLGLAGAIAAGGVAALLFGGRRLRSAQKKEDAAIDRKAKRDDVEIQQMSKSEVDEKRDEEARESVQEEERDQARQPTPPPAAQPQQAQPATGAHVVRPNLRDSRAVIERVENAVRQTLQSKNFSAYEFFYEIKTVGGRQQVQLDGLFRHKKHRGKDVILELKVIRQTRFFRGRTREFADRLLALLARYSQITPRAATGWLVIVLPKDVEPIDLEERRRLEDQANESLVDLARATILHEDEIADLGNRFTQLFETQAK
jgi:hypothetical protein